MDIKEETSSAGLGSFPRVTQLVNGSESIQTQRHLSKGLAVTFYYILHRLQFNISVSMRSRDNNDIIKIKIVLMDVL